MIIDNSKILSNIFSYFSIKEGNSKLSTICKKWNEIWCSNETWSEFFPIDNLKLGLSGNECIKNLMQRFVRELRLYNKYSNMFNLETVMKIGLQNLCNIPVKILGKDEVKELMENIEKDLKLSLNNLPESSYTSLEKDLMTREIHDILKIFNRKVTPTILLSGGFFIDAEWVLDKMISLSLHHGLTKKYFEKFFVNNDVQAKRFIINKTSIIIFNPHKEKKEGINCQSDLPTLFMRQSSNGKKEFRIDRHPGSYENNGNVAYNMHRFYQSQEECQEILNNCVKTCITDNPIFQKEITHNNSKKNLNERVNDKIVSKFFQAFQDVLIEYGIKKLNDMKTRYFSGEIQYSELKKLFVEEGKNNLISHVFEDSSPLTEVLDEIITEVLDEIIIEEEYSNKKDELNNL